MQKALETSVALTKFWQYKQVEAYQLSPHCLTYPHGWRRQPCPKALRNPTVPLILSTSCLSSKQCPWYDCLKSTGLILFSTFFPQFLFSVTPSLTCLNTLMYKQSRNSPVPKDPSSNCAQLCSQAVEAHSKAWLRNTVHLKINTVPEGIFPYP